MEIANRLGYCLDESKVGKRKKMKILKFISFKKKREKRKIKDKIYDFNFFST